MGSLRMAEGFPKLSRVASCTHMGGRSWRHAKRLKLLNKGDGGEGAGR
jgi:hypothetical protein